MDFKLRQRNDDRVSGILPTRSSAYTFFKPTPSMLAGQGRAAGGPYDVAELLHCEIEKKQIRKEIVAAEIMRRRELEEEVRRELQMEREIALLCSRERFGFQEWLSGMLCRPEVFAAGLESMSFQLQPEAEPLAMFTSVDVGTPSSLPPQRLSEVGVPVIEPLPERSSGEVVVMAKNSNLSRAKRKSEALATSRGGSVPSVNLNKRSQKEWRCGICQVNATSERGLNEHLRGKKHKAKEASLKTGKTTGKRSCNCAPKPVKTEKPTELSVYVGSMSPNKTKSPNENEEFMNMLNDEDMKEEETKLTEDEEKEVRGLKKQKYKHWCLMCKVGTNSEMLMETHRTGKKHMAGLLKNGGAVITISTMREGNRDIPVKGKVIVKSAIKERIECQDLAQ